MLYVRKAGVLQTTVRYVQFFFVCCKCVCLSLQGKRTDYNNEKIFVPDSVHYTSWQVAAIIRSYNVELRGGTSRMMGYIDTPASSPAFMNSSQNIFIMSRLSASHTLESPPSGQGVKAVEVRNGTCCLASTSVKSIPIGVDGVVVPVQTD